jgi:hypothetical protein
LTVLIKPSNRLGQVCISNAMGVNVMQLEARDFASSGKHTVNFSTERLEAGVYYISFSSDGFRQARKLVVVK